MTFAKIRRSSRYKCTGSVRRSFEHRIQPLFNAWAPLCGLSVVVIRHRLQFNLSHWRDGLFGREPSFIDESISLLCTSHWLQLLFVVALIFLSFQGKKIGTGTSCVFSSLCLLFTQAECSCAPILGTTRTHPISRVII